MRRCSLHFFWKIQAFLKSGSAWNVLPKVPFLSFYFTCFSSYRSWGGKLRVCSRHHGTGCEPGSYMQTSTAISVVSHALPASALTCLHLGAGLSGSMLSPGTSGNLGEWSWMRKAGSLVQWEEHQIQMRAMHLLAVWYAISELTFLLSGAQLLMCKLKNKTLLQELNAILCKIPKPVPGSFKDLKNSRFLKRD